MGKDYRTDAIGENIVITELLWEGWAPANLNSTVKYAPNADIIAAKRDHRVVLQVKTSSDRSKPMLRLQDKREPGPIFNSKDGPKADFIVFVRILSTREHECYVVPVEEAERVAQETYNHWLNTNKKDGTVRARNFPACIRFEPNKKQPLVSNYKVHWEKYKNAWHLLEG